MKTQRRRLLPNELLLDHPVIDEQHDEIFYRVESIKSAALTSGDLPVEELRSLTAFFAHHFATEVRLAREAGVPFSPAHAREHTRHLQLLERADAEIESGKLDLRSFLRYLEYWFEHHINEFDKALGEQLAQALARSAERSLAAAGSGVELSA